MKQLEKEEKRRKIWKYIVIGSSILILVILFLFIQNSRKINPLEGEWMNEDLGIILSIEDEKFTLESDDFELEMAYKIDKNTKTIVVLDQAADYEEAAENSKNKMTVQEIDEAISQLVNSYYYSVSQNTLTLLEREYGEQFVFERCE